MLKRQLQFLFFFLVILALASGQRPQRSQGPAVGVISGRIIDEYSSKPLEYANILVYRRADSSYINGTATDEKGNFILRNIPPGRFYLDVKFMGYIDKHLSNISVSRVQQHVDLGEISLKRTVLDAEGVDVIADRLLVEYQIDRKVVNVSQDYVNMAGTAVDILENVPSLTVDLEGNVSLRGSSSFTVLIDNRPTALDANDALQQIPASTIENIEIITNPSAKYDPDGMSGIINVITRKRRLEGISGIINTSGGLESKYGGDILLNYRNHKYNLSLGTNFNLRSNPGSSESVNKTYIGDSTSIIESAGTSDSERRRMGLNAEAQLFLSPRDNLTLGFRSGNFKMDRGSDLEFSESWDPGGIINRYISTSNRSRGGRMLMFSGDYQHKFKSDAEISFQTMAAVRDGDDRDENRLKELDQSTYSGQITTESGPASWLRYHLNYNKPLPEKGKFEAGYQGRISDSKDITGFWEYDTVSGQFAEFIQSRHNVNYIRNIQSLYSLVSINKNRFGYQLGFRSEYTDRSVILAEKEEGKIKRWDFFPTVHGSYKLTNTIQVMASYSRRINRPRGWYLEPFISWSDAYNVRQGNPGLKPEYINSYELSLQIPFRQSMLSVEGYTRQTNNKIERIHTIYTDNIMLHSIANVGTSQSSGIEFMLNYKEISWWELNISGNIYSYNVTGQYAEKSFNASSENWNFRLNNTFRIGEDSRIQITGRYRSPSATSQGTRQGYYSTDLGIKHNLIGRELSTTLQVRDVFATAVREQNFATDNFESYRKSSRKSPVVMLTLSYNFNNFREQRRRGTENGEEMEEEF